MSDIGFHGVAAAAVGVAMLAVTALALLIEGALWQRRKRGGAASPGALAFLAPMVYAGVAIALLIAVERGELELKEAMDRAAPVIAAVGLLIWITARVLVARRTPARPTTRI